MVTSIMIWLMYIIAGLSVGLLSGLLGIGGGVIIVPILNAIFVFQGLNPEHMMHFAVGTSLATVMLITGSASITHHRYQTVRWDLLRYLLPGLAIGALFGSWLANKISTDILRSIFAIVVILIAANLVFSLEKSHKIERSPSWIISCLGVGVGSISALIGIGGGILLVPLFKVLGLKTKPAMSTSVTATFFIATVGTCGAAWFGFVYWPAVVILGMTGMMAAPLGVRLSHIAPVKLLKRLLALILLLVAWRLGFA